ncbi:hypothetical protein [Fibrella aquatilis]|uniref:Uncharacterized protein n=1 Tax=Fibrella aquatilis TaxID=2817059 RepID=A0A939G5R1_9BACT|nr:hypothetical protein [Fibrella aquatilis]MBO0931535.1 hypothetical protein [Fibrella aquatilis]
MPALPSFFSLFNATQPPESQLTQTLVGAINNSVSVTLTLTTTGSLAHGTLLYMRSGIAIPVVGTLAGDELLLHEFDRKGNVTGIHLGKWSRAGYSGTWSSPSLPSRSLAFSLSTVRQLEEPRAKLADLTGLYQYGYSAKNRFSQVHIQQMGEKILAVAMLAVTDEPVQNQLTVSKTTVKLAGNMAVFSNSSIATSPLKLAFFNGGATICLSGAPTMTAAQDVTQGADMVVGHYIRTSTKPPQFSVDELARIV